MKADVMRYSGVLKYAKRKDIKRLSEEIGIKVAEAMDAMDIDGFYNAYLEKDELKIMSCLDNKVVVFLENISKNPAVTGMFIGALCQTIIAEKEFKENE